MATRKKVQSWDSARKEILSILKAQRVENAKEVFDEMKSKFKFTPGNKSNHPIAKPHSNIVALSEMIEGLGKSELMPVQFSSSHYRIQYDKNHFLDYWPKTGTYWISGSKYSVRKQNPMQVFSALQKAISELNDKSEKIKTISYGAPKCKECGFDVLITHEIAMVGPRMLHKDCYDQRLKA